MKANVQTIRLGTRGSKLARAQSMQVAEEIMRKTGVQVELVIITTRGDQVLDKPLAEIGGKGLFTAELEMALREGEIDFAVHSLKDLPTDDPEGLCIAAIPKRVDPRDVLVGSSAPKSIGTGSLRRGEQIRKEHPDIEIRGIRGNVDTRLAKLDAGSYDAIVLAAAGMHRLGIHREDARPLSISECVPAPAQGALGLQARTGDDVIHELLHSIHDEVTAACVAVERQFLASIQGGCNVAAGCCVQPREEGGYQIDAFHDKAPQEQISFVVADLHHATEAIISRLHG